MPFIYSQGFLVASTLSKAIERSGVKNIFGKIQAGHNITQIKLSNYLRHLASIPADRKYFVKFNNKNIII